jgi:hypothetical protein
MENDDPFIVRVGTFFLIMGFGTFILFVLSDIAEQPDFDYLFVALLLIGGGWYMRRGKAKPPPASRFSLLKRFRKGGNKSTKPAGKPIKEDEEEGE